MTERTEVRPGAIVVVARGISDMEKTLLGRCFTVSRMDTTHGYAVVSDEHGAWHVHPESLVVVGGKTADAIRATSAAGDHAVRGAELSIQACGRCGALIAWDSTQPVGPCAECQRNSAAALLEALRDCLELIDASNLGEKAWRERESKMVNRARAVLAQATGKETAK